MKLLDIKMEGKLECSIANAFLVFTRQDLFKKIQLFSINYGMDANDAIILFLGPGHI